MSYFSDIIFVLSVLIPWIGGVVLAAGLWKMLAIIFPPYAWYLFVERLMMLWGMI